MPNKLLTIATINLNNAGGLRKTINSLLPLRGDPDIDFVFQDGDSKDESLTVAKDFYRGDELLSQRDAGIYNAMNRSLHRARGEYIIWINSGDQFIPEQLEIVKNSILYHKPDMAIFATSIIEENGGSEPMHANFNNISKGIPHPSTVFATKKIKDVGCYDESFKIAGDLDLILRISRKKAKILISKEIISNFYLGGTSSSSNFWPETWRAFSKNKILPNWKRHLNILKYALILNIPIASKLRLKKLSVVSKEKVITLHDLGATIIHQN
ncbi:MAG: hypothetical protein RJB34_1256 [Pseudomonadota bacterium]|jgi:hypothetical protein